MHIDGNRSPEEYAPNQSPNRWAENYGAVVGVQSAAHSSPGRVNLDGTSSAGHPSLLLVNGALYSPKLNSSIHNNLDGTSSAGHPSLLLVNGALYSPKLNSSIHNNNNHTHHYVDVTNNNNPNHYLYQFSGGNNGVDNVPRSQQPQQQQQYPQQQQLVLSSSSSPSFSPQKFHQEQQRQALNYSPSSPFNTTSRNNKNQQQQHNGRITDNYNSSTSNSANNNNHHNVSPVVSRYGDQSNSINKDTAATNAADATTFMMTEESTSTEEGAADAPYDQLSAPRDYYSSPRTARGGGGKPDEEELHVWQKRLNSIRQDAALHQQRSGSTSSNNNGNGNGQRSSSYPPIDQNSHLLVPPLTTPSSPPLVSRKNYYKSTNNDGISNNSLIKRSSSEQQQHQQEQQYQQSPNVSRWQGGTGEIVAATCSGADGRNEEIEEDDNDYPQHQKRNRNTGNLLLHSSNSSSGSQYGYGFANYGRSRSSNTNSRNKNMSALMKKKRPFSSSSSTGNHTMRKAAMPMPSQDNDQNGGEEQEQEHALLGVMDYYNMSVMQRQQLGRRLLAGTLGAGNSPPRYSNSRVGGGSGQSPQSQSPRQQKKRHQHTAESSLTPSEKEQVGLIQQFFREVLSEDDAKQNNNNGGSGSSPFRNRNNMPDPHDYPHLTNNNNQQEKQMPMSTIEIISLVKSAQGDFESVWGVVEASMYGGGGGGIGTDEQNQNNTMMSSSSHNPTTLNGSNNSVGLNQSPLRGPAAATIGQQQLLQPQQPQSSQYQHQYQQQQQQQPPAPPQQQQQQMTGQNGLLNLTILNKRSFGGGSSANASNATATNNAAPPFSHNSTGRSQYEARPSYNGEAIVMANLDDGFGGGGGNFDYNPGALALNQQQNSSPHNNQQLQLQQQVLQQQQQPQIQYNNNNNINNNGNMVGGNHQLQQQAMQQQQQVPPQQQQQQLYNGNNPEVNMMQQQVVQQSTAQQSPPEYNNGNLLNGGTVDAVQNVIQKKLFGGGVGSATSQQHVAQPTGVVTTQPSANYQEQQQQQQQPQMSALPPQPPQIQQQPQEQQVQQISNNSAAAATAAVVAAEEKMHEQTTTAPTVASPAPQPVSSMLPQAPQPPPEEQQQRGDLDHTAATSAKIESAAAPVEPVVEKTKTPTPPPPPAGNDLNVNSSLISTAAAATADAASSVLPSDNLMEEPADTAVEADAATAKEPTPMTEDTAPASVSPVSEQVDGEEPESAKVEEDEQKVEPEEQAETEVEAEADKSVETEAETKASPKKNDEGEDLDLIMDEKALLKAKLVKFYTKYDTSKVAHIDTLLKKPGMNAGKVFPSLGKKYNVPRDEINGWISSTSPGTFPGGADAATSVEHKADDSPAPPAADDVSGFNEVNGDRSADNDKGVDTPSSKPEEKETSAPPVSEKDLQREKLKQYYKHVGQNRSAEEIEDAITRFEGGKYPKMWASLAKKFGLVPSEIENLKSLPDASSVPNASPPSPSATQPAGGSEKDLTREKLTKYYKHVGQSRSAEEVEDAVNRFEGKYPKMWASLTKKFGPLPPEIENLTSASAAESAASPTPIADVASSKPEKTETSAPVSEKDLTREKLTKYYKHVGQSRSAKEVEDAVNRFEGKYPKMWASLTKKFGPLPPEIENLTSASAAESAASPTPIADVASSKPEKTETSAPVSEKDLTREKLTKYYKHVGQSRSAKEVEDAVNRFEGKYPKMWASLTKKFGPLPSEIENLKTLPDASSPDTGSAQKSVSFQSPPSEVLTSSNEADVQREKLKQYYAHHNQNRSAEEIEDAVTRFEGKYPKMWASLTKKFGPVPPEIESITTAPPKATPKEMIPASAAATPSAPAAGNSNKAPHEIEKEKLDKFYKHYGETRTDAQLDDAINKFKDTGNYDKMWKALTKKYGPMPDDGSASPGASPAASSAPAPSTAASAGSEKDLTREKLTKYYKHVGQSRSAEEVEDAVNRFEGKYPKMWASLTKKFGPLPPEIENLKSGGGAAPSFASEKDLEREKLKQYYKHVGQNRSAEEIEDAMTRFEGKYPKMWGALTKKFGPLPPEIENLGGGKNSIQAIAAEHGVSVAALITANPSLAGMSPSDELPQGMELQLPEGPSTLKEIAKAQSLTVDDLRRANPSLKSLPPDAELPQGTELQLPAEGESFAEKVIAFYTAMGDASKGSSVQERLKKNNDEAKIVKALVSKYNISEADKAKYFPPPP